MNIFYQPFIHLIQITIQWDCWKLLIWKFYGAQWKKTPTNLINISRFRRFGFAILLLSSNQLGFKKKDGHQP